MQHTRGFTLIETAVVAAVIMFLVAAVAPSNVLADPSSPHARVTAFGNELLEQVRATDFQRLAPISGVRSLEATSEGRDVNVTVTWHVDVTNAPSSGRQVAITLNWEEGGQPHHQTLESVIAAP